MSIVEWNGAKLSQIKEASTGKLLRSMKLKLNCIHCFTKYLMINKPISTGTLSEYPGT